MSPSTTPSPLATSSPRVHGPDAGRRRDGSLPPLKRAAGVLAHVTSLPGSDGIGDLGESSRSFVTWLAQGGQNLWQMLPLTPPASQQIMSPYDSASVFAGNPLLISLDDLVRDGLLPPTVQAIRRSVGAQADGDWGQLDKVARWKPPLIQQAARQLMSLPHHHDLHTEFLHFCETQGSWLADYVAFSALREEYKNVAREQWPPTDRVRMLGARRRRSLDIGATHEHPEAAIQFLFARQRDALLEHARARNVRIIGDVPIYVGSDSADVWAQPDLFQLTDEFRPALVTGAPPDEFDPRGQVWGMPAYDWNAHQATGFEWWTNRLRQAFAGADIVRLDHFRGFADWWGLPPAAHFGDMGHWEAGPGSSLFDIVERSLGEVDFIAEDLGAETAPLQQLRADTGYPLLRALVQGFDEGGDSPHLPTAFTGNEAAYTSTHDFNTVMGWAVEADADSVKFALRYSGAHDIGELAMASIELAMQSQARYAIVPLQDWLGLGADARMNIPGTTSPKNWRWQVADGVLSDDLAQRMLSVAHGASRGAST